MTVQERNAEALNELPLLPRDENGPVFGAPWEAQVFAIVVQLAEQGQLTWSEWSDRLGAQFKQAAETGEAADGDRYYQHWLQALERFMVESQVTVLEELEQTRVAIAADDHHRRHEQLHQPRD